jgi:SAM-dependent methyltransferase
MDNDRRFNFGSNWSRFLLLLDEQRIISAQNSLREMLGVENLDNMSFLDAGCGSGLFSLAAHKLGASVLSIDFDPACVRCAQELKMKFSPGSTNWTIQQASVLDAAFLQKSGSFDIVYSWGVLHHTGHMKEALTLLSQNVKPGGLFFISLYNNQGFVSRIWWGVKKTYNSLPIFLRPLLVASVAFLFELKSGLRRLVNGQNPLPFKDWAEKKRSRGMSAWTDWVDWVGGFPFESAKPNETISMMRAGGFKLEKLKTVRSGWGCNEFVFRRAP